MRFQRHLFNRRPLKKQLWLMAAVLLATAGLYMLMITFAPNFAPTSTPELTKQQLASPPQPKENRLYIPKINVDVELVEGDSEAALEKGAWHRKPENGNPEKGGNFVLSAHRFQLGLTPQQTIAKSPFYHIDKLQSGDKVYVDYNQKRYAYEVTRKYSVDRFAIEIENASSEAKMTLYSCDLRGEAAGREVVEAKPVVL